VYRFLLPSRSILYFCCLLRQTETVLDSLMSLIRFLLCSQYTVSWQTGILHQKTHFHLLVEVVLRPYADILQHNRILIPPLNSPEILVSMLVIDVVAYFSITSKSTGAADTTYAPFGETSSRGEDLSSSALMHIPQTCLLRGITILQTWQHFWQHSNCRSCRQAVFLWKIPPRNDGFS
jgi:hypothetical protein